MFNLKKAFCHSLHSLYTQWAVAIWILLSCPIVVGQDLSGVAAQKSEISTLTRPLIDGPIDSVEVADRVLSKSVAERMHIEKLYTEEQAACSGKFFVTDCKLESKERLRDALTRMRPIEIEAGLFKRRTRAAQREKWLREKHTFGNDRK